MSIYRSNHAFLVVNTNIFFRKFFLLSFLSIGISFGANSSPDWRPMAQENTQNFDRISSEIESGLIANFIENIKDGPLLINVLAVTAGLTVRATRNFYKYGFTTFLDPALLLIMNTVIIRNYVIPSFQKKLSLQKDGFLRGSCELNSGIVLVAVSSNDWHGAFNGVTTEFLQDVGEEYAIYKAGIDSMDDLNMALNSVTAKCDSKIKSLIIFGHGDLNGIQLRNDFFSIDYRAWPAGLAESLDRNLEPNATIILGSCNTGWDSKAVNIAQTLASMASGRKVYAPNGILTMAGTRIYSKHDEIKADFDGVFSLLVGAKLSSMVVGDITKCYLATKKHTYANYAPKCPLAS